MLKWQRRIAGMLHVSFNVRRSLCQLPVVMLSLQVDGVEAMLGLFVSEAGEEKAVSFNPHVDRLWNLGA